MSEHDPEGARQRDLLNDGNPVQRLKMLADAHPETWGRLDAASLIGERKADHD